MAKPSEDDPQKRKPGEASASQMSDRYDDATTKGAASGAKLGKPGMAAGAAAGFSKEAAGDAKKAGDMVSEGKMPKSSDFGSDRKGRTPEQHSQSPAQQKKPSGAQAQSTSSSTSQARSGGPQSGHASSASKRSSGSQSAGTKSSGSTPSGSTRSASGSALSGQVASAASRQKSLGAASKPGQGGSTVSSAGGSSSSAGSTSTSGGTAGSGSGRGSGGGASGNSLSSAGAPGASKAAGAAAGAAGAAGEVSDNLREKAEEKTGAAASKFSKENMKQSGKDVLDKAADGAIQGGTDHLVDKTIGGDPNSATNRVTKEAAAGAAKGAIAGGLHGAAAGAVKGAGKGVAKEAGRALDDDFGSGATDKLVDKASDSKKDSKSDSTGKGDDDGRKLGAGGTSYARSSSDPDKDSSKKRDGVKAAAGVGVAAAAAPGATITIFLLMILAWLKTMFFKAMATALTFLQWLLETLKAIFMTIWNFVTAPFVALGSAFATVGSFVFGATSFMASTAAGVVVASFLGVLALGGGGAFVASNMLVAQAASEGLSENVGRVVCGGGGSGGDGSGGDESMPVGEQTEKNAQLVYSVFSSWGMSDTNIAGILGNWSQESGIDPTSVQNYAVGTFKMTPEKKASAQNTNNGIGLGQWTFGRNQLLRDFAAANNADWWELGVQLSFMVKGDSPSDVDAFKHMINNEMDSPGDAAIYFHHKWERSADGPAGLAEREADAEAWFGKMSGWEVDEGAVEDITGDFLDGSEDITGGLFVPNDCNSGGGGGGDVELEDGGLTQEQAQALIDKYNKEGDKYLEERYGAGGPATCSDGGPLHGSKVANCVSFSTYFVNKYTTYQQYPWGNGIQTAYTIAADTGKEMSSTPTPYSVGSGPGTSSAGHTLVVLGVEGDQVIVGEAGYCAFMGRVRVTSADALAAAGWKFVDMSDELLDGDEVEVD